MPGLAERIFSAVSQSLGRNSQTSLVRRRMPSAGDDAQVGGDGVKRRGERTLERRGVRGQDHLAACESRGHPEDRFAVPAGPDERTATADRDRPGQSGDVSTEGERGPGHGRGGIERPGQFGQMMLHTLGGSAAEQRQQLLVHADVAVITQHAACGEVAKPHGGVAERRCQQDVRSHSGREQPALPSSR